ncbi:hypothetical protein [Marinomonas sp. 2405UD68-3]|uniref:hypothetical protein n=1 Tax=Marinomonas sp. 2405UD68-3 TaxID=3391835 RepID=UPI0039C953D7
MARRNYFRLASRCLLLFYALIVISFPLSSQSYASLEDDFGNLSLELNNLTANDLSLKILTFPYGTVIQDVQNNPLSLAYLKGQGDLSGSPFSGEGLNVTAFQNIRPYSSLSDLDNTLETNSPDSIMGMFSLFSGYAVIILMMLSVAFRVGFQLISDGMDGANSTAEQDMLLKRVSMVSLSAAFSLALTAPIYKGYAILNLFLFSSLIVGIGVTNAFVMTYFEWRAVSVSPTLAVSPKTDYIVSEVLELAFCNSAYAASTGNSSSVDVKAITPMNFQIDYSACGSLSISQIEIDSEWFSFDTNDPIADSLDLTSKNNAEVQAIREYINKSYLIALNKLVVETKLIVSGLEKIASDPGISEFVRQCDIGRSSNFNVSQLEVEDKYYTLDGDALEACKGDGIAAGLVKLRTNFAADVDQIIKQAYLTAQGKLKIEESVDGKIDFVKTDKTVDIARPSTYGHYAQGWVNFPFFMTLMHNAQKKLIGLLQMEVNGGVDLKSYGEEGAMYDMGMAIGLSRYLNQISYGTTVLTDAEKSLSTLANANTMGEVNFSDVTSYGALVNMDGAVSNFLGRLMAKSFLIQSNEHVVGQYINAGHTIIASYIALSSAVGATSPFFSFVKSAVGGKTALEQINDSDKAGGSKGLLGEASSLLSKVGGGVFSIVGGAIGGAFSAYKQLMEPMFSLILPFAFVCAFVLPGLLALMFMTTVLKWFLQVIKTTLFAAVSAIKMYSSDGTNVLGEGAKEVMMSTMAVGIMPLLIVSSFIAVDLLVSPVVATYQFIIYQVFAISLEATAQGPLYIAALIGFLVVPPLYAMIYLYSFPSMAIDSVMQFLSLNLGVSGVSSVDQGVNRLTGAGGSTGKVALPRLAEKDGEGETRNLMSNSEAYKQGINYSVGVDGDAGNSGNSGAASLDQGTRTTARQVEASDANDTGSIASLKRNGGVL